MSLPKNLFYTKDHEWVKIEGDQATMGITNYAQSALGDITFVDLPKLGVIVKQTQWCATVESVKAASDVYAPLSGEIIKSNMALTEHPELVNKSAYEQGWFAVIKILDQAEKNKLMTAEKYEEYLKTLSK